MSIHHSIAFVFTASALVCFTGCAANAEPEDISRAADTNEQEDALVSRRVKLRIPVIDTDGKLLSRFNARLAALGEAPVPDFVTVDSASPTNAFTQIQDRWNDVLYDKLGSDAVDIKSYADPEDYVVAGRPSTKLCYTGNPYFVAGLLSTMTDSLMSDQFVLSGWKSGRGVWLDRQLTDDSTDLTDFLPAEWFSYRTTRKDVMVLFTTGDGGDDFRTNAIPRCATR